MIAFIDDHKDRHGVEPICRVLPIAPSTYYEHQVCQRNSWRRSAFARRIVGWRVSNSLSAALVLDALEQALYDREISPRSELIHHSDRGVQYLSIRYTERLCEVGIRPSVGRVGDSYDCEHNRVRRSVGV